MDSELLQMVYFGNTVQAYLICAGIFAGAALALLGFTQIVLSRLKKWAEQTKTKVDDFVIGIFHKNIMPLLYYGAFYISMHRLVLPAAVNKFIDAAGVILITIMAIRFLVALSSYILYVLWIKPEQNEARERSLKGMLSVIKIIIWGIGVVFLLDNLGFKVSTVIAGLGIGGIAVALAAQTVLGDLFSFFSILFDRPFEVGDFIIIGDYLGAVEHIGIKTTRLRSLGGEQLIFSNTDLTNSRVRNYKRMKERRVVFSIGVTYQTPQAKVKEIPQSIESIIKSVKDARFDRAHFFSYGDSSLIFEIVYYALTPDYNKYMDIQQNINLQIMKKFEEEKIEFAYPTQTLYVSKD